jgi:hypothetical protein
MPSSAATSRSDPSRARQALGFRIVEVGANLGQVAAVNGAGMDVDAMRALAHDLFNEQVSETPCQRSVG